MPDQLEIAKYPACFCGRAKAFRHIFCNRCFSALTESARHALYHAHANDFAAVYDRCVAQLRSGRKPVSPRYVVPRRSRSAGQTSWFGD